MADATPHRVRKKPVPAKETAIPIMNNFLLDFSIPATMSSPISCLCASLKPWIMELEKPRTKSTTLCRTNLFPWLPNTPLSTRRQTPRPRRREGFLLYLLQFFLFFSFSTLTSSSILADRVSNIFGVSISSVMGSLPYKIIALSVYIVSAQLADTLKYPLSRIYINASPKGHKSPPFSQEHGI